jgi:hypothetical protein
LLKAKDVVIAVAPEPVMSPVSVTVRLPVMNVELHEPTPSADSEAIA